MCGFVLSFGHKTAFEAALNSIAYRGLEGHTSVYEKGYWLIGHQRLPIVNLSHEGDQPKYWGDIPGFLVGEIFNYQQFYRVDTDTEAITRRFHDSGLKGFMDFDGFWAFITMYDGSPIVINDHLGIKPVYYRTDCKAVASEPASLLPFGYTPYDSVFFSNIQKWGYDMTGRTPWEHIKQLPPGHYWHDGVIKPYWDWNAVPHYGLRSGMERAVSNRLLGDRPIACLLSGGLDSTIVYKLAQSLGANLESFHVANDEAEYAKLVDPNTKELELFSVPYKRALQNHQSPVDLGSVHPQEVLMQAVEASDYYVCLTGDGADELYGGYSRIERYDSQASDIFCELPYYHLPRLDRISMRHTIELRSPFLSPHIVANALKTPYQKRIHKQILKETFEDLVPKEILNRPKKALRTEAITVGGVQGIQKNINLFKDIYDSSNLRIQH